MAVVMGSRARGTQLHAEGDLRVLWLLAGRSEIALSVEGLWFRRGRRQGELLWSEVQQLQAVPAGGPRRSPRVRVEVFDRQGAVHTLGPFARPQAERWVLACVQAAEERGEQPLALDGALGFALPA